MSAGTTTFRTILEKPLNQLTEDDISQLTREDCRKFLKEKGPPPFYIFPYFPCCPSPPCFPVPEITETLHLYLNFFY